MQESSRTLIRTLAWVAAAMVGIVVFHLGGTLALRVGKFSPLTGAIIGGSITIFCALWPRGRKEQSDPWLGYEQISWLLIGCGILLWGMGESFWRYYVSIGQAPFPSFADIGYSAFPLLVFTGLLLQPRPANGSKRLVLVMDSLISMGSILAIAWYLLLGQLAQAPGEANLAKFLGLYYPAGDTALLSCIVFLLLRGQGRVYQSTARRTGLLIMGLGLCFFIASDFIFNVQNNAGTYVEATWIDLGWPLGMMTIGIAAFLRRFLPATSEEIIEERMANRWQQAGFSPLQFVPYALVALLFLTLSLDSLSRNAGQNALRPVLLFATLGVVGLIVVRQVLTMLDNMRLTRRQAEALEDLGIANQRIETQSRQIAEYNMELERGIDHLKDVQACLANGNLRARANLTRGALLPLAGSLNLMAERLMRLEQVNFSGQRIAKALDDLSANVERHIANTPLFLPESCRDIVEIHRLLVALRIRVIAPSPSNPANQALSSVARTPRHAPPTPPPTGVAPSQASSLRAEEQAARLPMTQPLMPQRSLSGLNTPTREQPSGTHVKFPGLRRSALLGNQQTDAPHS